MRPLPRAVLFGAFTLFLAAFAFWGARNPRLKIDSDPSTYLRFAETLARGGYYIESAPDRIFAEHYPPGAIYKGTYTTVMRGGRGIAFYAIGYPLYLAAFVALFGVPGAFFANLLVWIALLVLLWAVTRLVFDGHPAGEAAALAAPALYWLWNGDEVSYLLAPYRDPLAHALLLGAALCLLRSLRAGTKPWLLLLGGVLFGYSVAVRETSILAALPLGLLWLHHAVAERRVPRASALAAAALGALLGVAPLLAQNWVNTGSPFYPTQVLDAQVRMGNISDEESELQFGMRGLRIEHFRRTEPLLVEKLLNDRDPVFASLLALGVAAGIRAPGVPWLLLPFIAVFTLFFGLWVKPMMRYILVAQVAAVPLAAHGAATVAALAGRALRLPRLPEALAALLLGATGLSLLASSEPAEFGIAEAEALRRDFEAQVPAGGVVFAERPMCNVLDHLTHADAVRLNDLVRPERGLTFAVAARSLLRESPGLWFFDSVDSDRRDRFDSTPRTRERLLERYDLEPAARFAAARYAARDLFGADSATLWRLVPWSRRGFEAQIEVPAGGALVRLDARGLLDEVPGEVRVDGTLVAGRLEPRWNWISLPARATAGPARLEVTAQEPITAELSPRVFATGEPITLEAGPEVVPLDSGFLSPEFAYGASVRGQRGLQRRGVVRVPAPPLAGAAAVLVARLRGVADDVVLPVRFSTPAGTTERMVHGSLWRTVAVPLGQLRGPETAAAVGVEVLPRTAGPPGPLGLDRVTVVQERLRRLPLFLDFGTDGDGAWAAEGFYEPERYLDRHTVRATDGASLAFLPLAPGEAGRPARLEVAVHGMPGIAGSATVRLALNGAELGEFSVAPESQQRLEAPVPAGVLRGGLNELAIEGTTWRPADFGAVDPRRLGVLVDEVRVEPAGGPGGGSGR